MISYLSNQMLCSCSERVNEVELRDPDRITHMTHDDMTQSFQFQTKKEVTISHSENKTS